MDERETAAPAAATGEEPATPRRRTALWKKLGLALASLVLTLLLLEFVAWLFMPSHAPVQAYDGYYVNTLPLVTGHAPPQLVRNTEGEPLTRDKRPGEVRVFVFGESSIEGVPYPRVDSSPAMLYDILRSRYPEQDITVVNMGRTGSIATNTWYHLQLVSAFSPDWVIFYLGANDGERGMLGEQCAIGTHPALHGLWRWAVSHSWLLWTVRSLGPALLWSGDGASSGPSGRCEVKTPGIWYDELVRSAMATGAQVVATVPVYNMMYGIEPLDRSSDLKQGGFRDLDSEYEALLRCKLTPDCDFSALLADTVDAHPGRFADTKSRLSAMSENWRRAAARHGALLVDFQEALREVSPRGVLGGDFFTDEMHLTLEGYGFLARMWAAALAPSLGGQPAPPPTPPSREDVLPYWERLEWTTSSMARDYFCRGWYLTALPAIQEEHEMRPDLTSGADDLQLWLAWLRMNVGLPPQIPAERLEEARNFDPCARR